MIGAGDARDAASEALRLLAGARRRGLARGASLRGVAQLLANLARRRADLAFPLEIHALDRPHAPAVTDDRRTWTWRALCDEADALAGYLATKGVGAGHRVAVASGNRGETFAVSAAASRLGCVPVPLSPASPPAELTARLAQANAVAAIVEPWLAGAARAGLGDRGRPVVVFDDPLARDEHALRAAGSETTWPDGALGWSEVIAARHPRPPLRRRSADAPTMVLYTSGTTGRSKGARVRTDRAGPLTALRYLEAFDIDRDTVFFTPCPLYHGAPILLTGLTVAAGGQVVVSRRFDDPVRQLLTCGATHAFLVPTLFERLSRLPPADLGRLRRSPMRVMVSGGAAMRPALKTALLDELGPVLHDFYGATEIGVVSVAGPADLAVDPASVGPVLRGVEVRLVGDDGKVVEPGERGLLYVRGAAVGDGYEGEDADPAAEGWVTAGDVARLVDGRLHIVDRQKDLVISGGVNLFPVDIEEAVERHPTVREAAAVGVPDPDWGEALHVFVVMEDGVPFDARSLDAHCRAHLARYAVPKGIHPIDSLPRSPTGKVLRRALRARLVGEEPGA